MVKIKLDKTLMFVLLLGVLVLASLGFTLKESFETTISIGDSTKAASEGSSYDPFGDGANNQGARNQAASNQAARNQGGFGNQYAGGNRFDLSPTRSEREATQGTAQSALPRGIPKSQIVSGNEDLYILKSEVVPPVCPKCPDSRACPRSKPCPACPSCARCPEPSFECKKVPTYAATNSRMPRPFLNDFSQFA
jgi:hypothetical protein